MKKSLLIIALLLVGLNSSAQDMWGYAIQAASTAELSAGAGSGWYVSLLNAADDSELASRSIVANNAGNIYISGWTTPALNEGLSVYYRIFNDTVAKTIIDAPYWQIDSQEATFQDLSAGYLPGANAVTLSFSGSEWVEVVPEPATALLFGIGGIGAFIVRRNKRKTLEEADA